MDDDAVSRLLREHAARHSVPGAAVGIVRGGGTVTAYTGVADATTGEPVTAETRFAVGSLCKSMLATALAGVADFDADAAAYAPELRGAAWAERATIRDLLATRSRLPPRAELEFEVSPDDLLRDLTARLADADETPPIWSYSNVGRCVLGRVLEEATGLPWEDAMRREAFEPGDGGDALHDRRGRGAAFGGARKSRPAASSGRGPGRRVRSLCGIDRALDASGPAAIRAGACRNPDRGWDRLISGERSVLGWCPSSAARSSCSHCTSGRSLHRSLVPELMDAWFDVRVPSLAIEPRDGSAGDLARYPGVYAWTDRSREVEATGDSLLLSQRDRVLRALPIDARTFLVDASDPDMPTVTFDSFDAAGRPGVLYELLGVPRSP